VRECDHADVRPVREQSSHRKGGLNSFGTGRCEDEVDGSIESPWDDGQRDGRVKHQIAVRWELSAQSSLKASNRQQGPYTGGSSPSPEPLMLDRGEKLPRDATSATTLRFVRSALSHFREGCSFPNAYGIISRWSQTRTSTSTMVRV
jgi:hypothetical protein